LQSGTDIEETVGRSGIPQPYLVIYVIYVANIDYDCKVEHVWQFIQKIVYAIFDETTFTVHSIEGLTMEIPSVMAGVDACLKLIYVANIAYDCKVEHVWQFIQKIVYTIFDETTFASVYDLQDPIMRCEKKLK